MDASGRAAPACLRQVGNEGRGIQWLIQHIPAEAGMTTILPPHDSSFSRDQGAGRATQRAAVLIRASARRRPSSRRATRISPEAGKTPVSAVILT